MGIHLNTALCQNVLTDRTRSHAGCGDAAGKVAAAAGILPAFIFGICRVIRVAGAQQIRRFCIISAAGVGVADHHGDGGAGGMAVDHTAQKLHHISAGAAAVHPLGDVRFIHRQPRGQTVQHSADGGTVAFAKDGQAQRIAKGIFHRLSPRFP